MIKQYIIVRKSLNLKPGKLAAQVAHAAINGFKFNEGTDLGAWFSSGQTKIVLGVNSDEEFYNVFDKIKQLGIFAQLITDEGRTEIKANTDTCFAVGPIDEELVKPILGTLLLY